MSKETEKGKSTSLAISNFELNIDLLNHRKEAFALFTDMLKGRKQGVSNPTEAMMVYMRCKELNIPFANALDHMAIVQGKICADIHIKTTLALRARRTLWWEKIKDYEPQYKYTDGANSWISPLQPLAFIKEHSLIDPVLADAMYVWNEASYEKAIKANKTPIWNACVNGDKLVHNIPWDYVTEYKFVRLCKLEDGTTKEMIAYGRFSSLEGHLAQLGYGGFKSDYAGVRDPNSNWGKYERRMVTIRAFDNGLKEIAADLTMGMPEIGEMAEVAGISYSFDEASGNASVAYDFQESVEDSIAEEVNQYDPDGNSDSNSTDNAANVNGDNEAN